MKPPRNVQPHAPDKLSPQCMRFYTRYFFVGLLGKNEMELRNNIVQRQAPSQHTQTAAYKGRKQLSKV